MFGVPYHVLIVHFPIVLILGALFYDARGTHDVGYRLTIGAAASAVLAMITGLMLSGGRLPEVTIHAGAGIGGGLAAVVLAVFRYSSKARDQDGDTPFPTAWIFLGLLAGFGIAVAAVTGHRAVFGY